MQTKGVLADSFRFLLHFQVGVHTRIQGSWCIVNQKKISVMNGYVTWRMTGISVMCGSEGVNPLTAKLFNLNFHPLEVVSRWRDPQLQVSENYSDLTKWR